MKYFVYFDPYGHPNGVISEKELNEKHDGDPDEFLKAMSGLGPRPGGEYTSGHVSVLRFDNPGDLKDYLDSLGDEIEGFYGGEAQSRPYNF